MLFCIGPSDHAFLISQKTPVSLPLFAATVYSNAYVCVSSFFSLFISTTTWQRDSHELFDYEARHVHRKSCELKVGAKVFRDTLDVQVVIEGQPLPAHSADFLLSIRERDGKLQKAHKYYSENTKGIH